ncbi:hypothetical protein [Halomonas denitrificans]|nr:hypothetical protein [Halomonas denitrificans]
MKRNRLLDGLLGLLLLLPAAPLLAEGTEPAEPVFLRVSETAEGAPDALQVAVAGYRAEDGTRLDLVGAVHVADEAYFEALNRSFDDYDVVLYELVGDPDAAASARDRSTDRNLSAVGFLQGGMKDVLGLAFQLDEIDYDRDHFVHADMTAEEFSASMEARNESMLGMLFRAWIAGMAQQTPDASAQAQVDLLKILLADDRQLALKRMFARQLATEQDVLEAMSGPEGSTLITERNRKALDVLERERASGHRRIALFYGAGHFPDFHRRLVADHGFEPVDLRWLDAWRLD